MRVYLRFWGFSHLRVPTPGSSEQEELLDVSEPSRCTYEVPGTDQKPCPTPQTSTRTGLRFQSFRDAPPFKSHSRVCIAASSGVPGKAQAAHSSQARLTGVWVLGSWGNSITSQPNYQPVWILNLKSQTLGPKPKLEYGS